MSNCLNCNSALKPGAKFCVKCGTPVEVHLTTDEPIKSINFRPESDSNPLKKTSLFIKLLLGIAVIVFIIFVGNSYFSDSNPIEKTSLASVELSKLEGNWYDHTGIMLGDKTALIKLQKVEDVVKGQDEKGLIEIELRSAGGNKYNAKVIFRGLETDFDALFYEDENKLEFVSRVTKASWYIKKLK